MGSKTLPGADDVQGGGCSRGPSLLPAAGSAATTIDALQSYLAAISSVPLLTAAQEVELARAVEAGLLARDALACPVPLAPRADLRTVAANGHAAHQQLVLSNLRLVVAVARRWSHRGVPTLDLIQEGNVGLLHAVRRWDFTRGTKFSTYATWWVRKCVAEAAATLPSPVSVPPKVAIEAARVRGTDPGGEGPASSPGVGVLLARTAAPLSLEQPVATFEAPARVCLADLLVDEEQVGTATAALALVEREQVLALLRTLPPRDKLVLSLRYGLLDGQARSLAQVGTELHLTRGRILQLERRAFTTLRHDLLTLTGTA